jgi:hypothetical protein
MHWHTGCRLLLIACLSTSFTVSVAEAQNNPSRYLKGVKSLTYHGFLEVDKGRCSIDWKAWNTEIDFVAINPPGSS